MRCHGLSCKHCGEILHAKGGGEGGEPMLDVGMLWPWPSCCRSLLVGNVVMSEACLRFLSVDVDLDVESKGTPIDKKVLSCANGRDCRRL